MDKQTILKELEFVQVRVTEIEEDMLQTGPDEKGYVGKVEAYNKWIDRYNALIDKLDQLDHEEVEKKQLKKKETVDIIFKAADLGLKILVPIFVALVSLGIAKLSYANDQNLELCNGRIFGSVKDVLKLIKL